jgi:ATP-dependent Lhr-like helicase
VNPLRSFTTPTRAWFEASFSQPTPAQMAGWEAISTGSHTLIHAPTGSGKTLAAFLWVLDRLHSEPLPPPARRCRVLYVSPLKALAYDINRNLRAPLAGIRHAAERLGQPAPAPLETFLRTGDTPAADRQRMLRHPPDILITTPESLFLMVNSAAGKVLASVRWVIVDEVHALAGSKRGAHLALSLERLEDLAAASPQRIGLSATQRPLSEIARFLGGGEIVSGRREDRPVVVVDAPAPRPLDLEIVVPVDDMTSLSPVDPLYPETDTTQASIWPAIYPRILELVDAHRSTIVFANSRRLAERICAQVNSLAGAEISMAHHGSVARQQRVMIEERLKRGELKAVVATSSLELGIDMGAVDLVIQVEAPVSVASGLQRVGRSGHHFGGESRARVFPKYRGDLLAAAVMARQMVEGDIEETIIVRNPLDVLSQQLVAQAAAGDVTAEQLFATVTRSTPFSELPRELFDATLDMLSGRYPSDEFAELKPRLTWDRVTGAISARPGARQLVSANAGTIPDRGLFRVVMADGSRVGELDEEMVYESRVGDLFVLGASTWRIVEISHDRVAVVPAPGAPGARMPFWKGDSLGRPFATGERIGGLVRSLGSLSFDEAVELLTGEYHLDPLAASNLASYVAEQNEATGVLPTDQTLVVESFRDEIGDWRAAILSPFGARVHAPWALAIAEKVAAEHGQEPDLIWTDDGIALRFVDAGEKPDLVGLLPTVDELRPLLERRLPSTALYGARFREAAGRALLLPRRRVGSRTPLWMQRRRAADLLGVARRYGDFPIVLETYREILNDDFDLPALEGLLRRIASRRIRMTAVETPAPSPFASSLLFAFVAAFLYEADTPAAERRAAALTLDRRLLRSLLGEGELGELVSPEVMTAVELDLQHLTPERRARTPDAVHDLLRVLGPLTFPELEARCQDLDLEAVLGELMASHRVVEVGWGEGAAWAAIEDASRLRDALGMPLPPGIPQVFLEPVADPLGDVIARFARTNGPFSTATVASRLQLPPAVVEATLRSLEAQGRVSRGRFGASEQWVDLEVLRRLKRRSLSALRQEIEPVEPKTLAAFLPAWHRIRPSPARGRSVLLDTLTALQGVEIPASVLERDVLPTRVASPGQLLDQLMLEGQVVWAGRGSLGPRDGKVALYFRDSLSELWFPPSVEPPTGSLPEAIRVHLATRGASFFRDIYTAAGGGDPEEVLSALWDLVWAGEVTNDTMAPLRSLSSRRRLPGRPHLAAAFPPESAGRWSLLEAAMVSPTEQKAAWARALLDRHGVVTRGAVSGEGVPGGFSGLYPVFSRLEETGRIRRGYFVEGLGAAQFAYPGAVDLLRSGSPPGVVALATTDPANPFGWSLPWPESASGRPGRAAGSYVLVATGEAVAYLERGGRRLSLFTDIGDITGEIARELAAVASRYRRFTLEEVDGGDARGSRLEPALREWGFVPALRGLAYRSPAS